MEHKYNPSRAVELTTFLEGLSVLELRWIQGAANVVLDKRVEEAERVRDEARAARWAVDLHWTADGRLVETRGVDEELQATAS
jgi:hypothetical protein